MLRLSAAVASRANAGDHRSSRRSRGRSRRRWRRRPVPRNRKANRRRSVTPATPQNGVRFCPTETLEQRVPTLRRRAARRRRDAARQRQRPVPDDRDDARLGRQQDATSSRAPRPATATRPSTTTTSTTPSTATRSSTTPRAAGAARAASPHSREDPGCKEGWIRLADQRYEARDTQYLLGLLADENVTKPQRDRRHRHLLRRRPEHRARLPEEPDPPAQRRIRSRGRARRAKRWKSRPRSRAGRGLTWSTR